MIPQWICVTGKGWKKVLINHEALVFTARKNLFYNTYNVSQKTRVIRKQTSKCVR